MRKTFKETSFVRVPGCILAGTIMAINYRTFVHTGGLLPGGFAGVTFLLQNVFQRFFNFDLPYAPVYLLLNFFPIMLGYKKIGKKFTIFSCVTIVVSAVLTDIIPIHVITYDPLLISVFGGLINGFAISICLHCQATSGGTDFISIYISEKYGIDAWNYIFYFNMAILGIDGILFGWDKALYSIIFQFTSTQILTILYKRYRKNTLLIVTNYPDEVAQTISEITTHGATDIDAYGSYSNDHRTLVYSVVSEEELNRVVSRVETVDPEAFINVIRTERLIGKFNMRPTD